MPQVFCSWSGGKDCCLACHRAIVSGLEVCYLANTITEDGQRSRSHGISAEAIRVQAQAIGIRVIQQRTTDDAYESKFIEMLKALKQEGIEGGVFGDIDFNPHREWIERVCRKANVTPYLPLWGEDQKRLMEEFIDAGFKAIVVTGKANLFGEEVLGQKVDRAFIARLEELGKTEDITPCGEAGEYHTLVIGGPIFQKRLEITKSSKLERDGYRFLEISSIEIKEK